MSTLKCVCVFKFRWVDRYTLVAHVFNQIKSNEKKKIPSNKNHNNDNNIDGWRSNSNNQAKSYCYCCCLSVECDLLMRYIHLLSIVRLNVCVNMIELIRRMLWFIELFIVSDTIHKAFVLSAVCVLVFVHLIVCLCVSEFYIFSQCLIMEWERKRERDLTLLLLVSFIHDSVVLVFFSVSSFDIH